MSNEKHIFIYCKHDETSLKQKNVVKEALIQEGFTIAHTSNDANMILSIGGDGTFLQSVRKTGFCQDCLYAGISTTNHHSFYCDFHYSNLSQMTQTLRHAQLEVRNYPLIEVIVDQQQPYYCLNEFSVRSHIIRTFALDVYIDHKLFETFLGDGLIISTPTGSTAYNKSVNGAIVDPLLPCFQVTELASVNNNQYRTLGVPSILSGQRSLQLCVHQDGNDFPIMAADNEALGVRQVEKIHISLSDKTIKTVKLKNNSFWEKVQRIHI